MAFVEGNEAEEPVISLRLNNMKKGEYYVMYRPEYKPEHTVKRLNLVFYSKFQPKKSEQEFVGWLRAVARQNKVEDERAKSALPREGRPGPIEKKEEEDPPKSEL